MNPHDPTRCHFVYWLFGAEGKCLYVGVTRRPEQRWRQHCKEKPLMAKQVVRRRMAGPYFYGTALRIERRQQDLLHPAYDKRGRERRATAARLAQANAAAARGGRSA